MKRVANVSLSALSGMVLFDAWLGVASNFHSELLAALLFLPFLAGQAALLYVLHKREPLLWSLVSSALALGFAIPGGVLLLDTRNFFDWHEWNRSVLPVVWYMKGFFAAYLVVPLVVVFAGKHERSNYRWSEP